MDHRPTVLVIEDSPVVQHLLRATLSPIAAEVLVAGDGESGLDMAGTNRPDVITLDIGLPGIDGWQVLAALRAAPATATIPVIVLTAHVQESMVHQAASLGAEAFLAKPFKPVDLRLAVESVVSRTRQTPAAALSA